MKPQPATVTFDDEAVRYHRFDGQTETVRWSELQIVFIQTTDDGPFADDVFWVLGSAESNCVIPSETEGLSLLLERLQDLPGFNNDAVIQAMSCTENQTFVCWEHQDGTVD